MILAAAVLGLIVIEAPARAVHADGGLPCTPVPNGQGAATCTAELDNQVQVIPVGPPCGPAGYAIWTASGHIHWEKIPGRCVYFTGDAASVDEDGYFWFSGRADEIIKIAGHRIGTIEVETAFLRLPRPA